MLRAISGICVDRQTLSLFSAAKRDVFRLFRTSSLTSAASPAQTVLSSNAPHNEDIKTGLASSSPTDSPVPEPPPPPPRRSWTVAAAALAITASLGGVYFYKKISDEDKVPLRDGVKTEQKSSERERRPIPPSADVIPRHIQYLLVGAGTASFAAMRAIRSQKPEAQVVMVGAEHQLPYMRPPLSKELWREPNLHDAADLDALTFKQWNGRTRSVSYEPSAFYTPVESLNEDGGTAVLRGWTVSRLDVDKHQAELVAPGCDPVTVTYDKCLIATGSRPRRVAALRGAARAGRALPVRTLQDVQRLAAALESASTRRVLVLGAGFLATELSAALAARLKESEKSVIQMYREGAPLEAVLPDYLAEEAGRALAALGVSLIPNAEITEARVLDDKVQMRLQTGDTVEADLVVECVGSDLDTGLATASQLELHPDLGGLLVNAELQARSDVYAAGDVACFYDVVLGRRRLEHHDHAVLSGRLAGENMARAAAAPAKHYTHQSMFWSDLGPQLGYEAIGVIDSELPTVGVFSEGAVRELGAPPTALRSGRALALAAGNPHQENHMETPPAPESTIEEGGIVSEGAGDARALSYERGVVFYLRGGRVVGVLLWNLFNRMHVARQVLAQGEFEDLFEVAKLFSLHEDD